MFPPTRAPEGIICLFECLYISAFTFEIMFDVFGHLASETVLNLAE